jgi:hypothetical protein
MRLLLTAYQGNLLGPPRLTMHDGGSGAGMLPKRTTGAFMADERTTILGMPVVVNPTLPSDTVEIRSAHNRVRIINLETDPKGDQSKTTDPRLVLLAVASMHDRAARRARRDSARCLVHEECALHLRAISDDEEATAALIAGIDKTELTAGDLC